MSIMKYLRQKIERDFAFNISLLHWNRDKLVDYKPQRNEIKTLLEKGVKKADFKLIDEKHILEEKSMRSICKNNRHYTIQSKR